MSRIVRVAGVQMGVCSLNKEENLERAAGLFRAAAKYQPHIVCFNELFQTCFFAVNYYEDASSFFETIPGPTTDRLASLAREYGCHVIAGLAEITAGREQYNSAVIIGPDGGLIGRYRKAHMPLNVSASQHRHTYEKNYFRPGNLGFPVFDLGIARVGLAICYDRHFPEPFRVMSLKGAEIIFIPTAARSWQKNWRPGMWEALLKVRAYENCVYIVGIDKAGREDETQYLGRSLIVSPLGGEILAASEQDGDDVICAELDLDLLARAHAELPVNRDRRPEFYGLLADDSRL